MATKVESTYPRPQRLFPDMIIRKAVKGNPRREGTKGWERFQIIRNGMTVAQFQKAGGSLKDLRWDFDHDHVEIFLPE